MISLREFKLSSIFIVFTFVFITTSHSSVCTIPEEAALEDVSSPDHVIGTGTPQSCTSSAFVEAVAQGGIITFDCGPDPVTITLQETAKIFNDTALEEPDIVIDGGNLITLSGGGNKRILYMNTCDPKQKWTTEHCQNQDHPRLSLQNLTFVDGNSIGEEFDGGGGGAVFVRGGRFKILNCRFRRNRCDHTGPDVGGAAVRVLSQFQGQPVYVVDSVFGGAEGQGNVCSNGGGLSSIGVSFTVINSLFSHNRAIGSGGNPARSGTPGGGSGAAIYNDGNYYFLNLCGTAIHDNQANEYGGSIFFVSNDHTGNMSLVSSGLWHNDQRSWLTHAGGISFRSDRNSPTFSNTYRSDDEEIPIFQTIDIDGDEKIGLAEIIHTLAKIAGGKSPKISQYARKIGDINYDHEIGLHDVVVGLKILGGGSF